MSILGWEDRNGYELLCKLSANRHNSKAVITSQSLLYFYNDLLIHIQCKKLYFFHLLNYNITS